MKLRKGRPASGSTGFGVVSVSGRRRVPAPPASTSACTSGSSRGVARRAARLWGRQARTQGDPIAGCYRGDRGRSMAGPEAADARAPSREEPLTGYGRRDGGGAADAPVRETGGHERVAGEGVAALDDQRGPPPLPYPPGPVQPPGPPPFRPRNPPR